MTTMDPVLQSMIAGAICGLQFAFTYNKWEMLRRNNFFLLCFNFALCGGMFFLTTYTVIRIAIKQ